MDDTIFYHSIGVVDINTTGTTCGSRSRIISIPTRYIEPYKVRRRLKIQYPATTAFQKSLNIVQLIRNRFFTLCTLTISIHLHIGSITSKTGPLWSYVCSFLYKDFVSLRQFGRRQYCIQRSRGFPTQSVTVFTTVWGNKIFYSICALK